MKPAPFAYFSPGTVDEAIELLGRHPEGRLLAGGQSLVPMMNLRLAQPEVLIDLNRVGGLDRIEPAGDSVRIGAMVRQCALERSAVVRDRLPLLRQAVSFVGHPATRHRGTVGGSAAHADPSAELPVALCAYDATFVTRGPRGARELSAEDFFIDYYTSALAPEEVLEEVRVPVPAGETRVAFLELARRQNDFPVAAVGVVLGLDGGGRCTRARVVLGGCGPGPVHARDAEALLVSAEPTAETFAEAALRAVAATSPLGGLHGSEHYVRRVAETLTRRALTRALEAGRTA